MTVYSPSISSYTVTSPYITPAEYLASPTGVNVSQLVPRGTEDQNADALKTVIIRASSYADQICRQVLAATRDIESGRYRLQRGGVLRIPATFSPVIAVEQITVGFAPSSMATVTDMSNVWVDRKVVTTPIGTLPLVPTYGALAPDGRVYATMTYINGWANGLLTSAASTGNTTLIVDNPLGMAPGVQLTIFDSGKTEVIYVQSVSGNTITLTTPLVYDHAVGVNVSAFPDAIKQAIVLLTSALIKTRGSEAIVMSQIRATPSQTVAIEGGGIEEIAMAKELLSQYVRTV